MSMELKLKPLPTGNVKIIILKHSQKNEPTVGFTKKI